MFLTQVAEQCNNGNSDNLTEHRLPVPMFYQKFKEKIIKNQIDNETQQISKQLDFSFEIRASENNIFI